MISNCAGCKEDWETICDYVRKGYILATENCIESTVGEKGHLINWCIIDKKGNWIIG